MAVTTSAHGWSLSSALSHRAGDPRQRQRLLRHEHFGQLWLPAAGARHGGSAGPAAQPLQLHTPSNPAPLEPLAQTQQSHAVTELSRPSSLPLHHSPGTAQGMNWISSVWFYEGEAGWKQNGPWGSSVGSLCPRSDWWIPMSSETYKELHLDSYLKQCHPFAQP